MSYSAIVCKLKDVRPHSNAQRLQLATVVGYQVIVGLDRKEGDLGVFFSDDGALSPEMLRENNLYSHSELNKDLAAKGYFDNTGRVRAQTFRGERSYGFWCELSCLTWTGADLSKLKEGTTFTQLNENTVCYKYITEATKKAQKKSFGGKIRKTKKTPLSIRFADLKRHFDTQQLRYYINYIPVGSIIIISSKLHGTSGRTGRILAPLELPPWKEWANRYFSWTGKEFSPKKAYQYITGSRKIVFDPAAKRDTGYYTGSTMRKDVHDEIREKGLPKGITLYYEIVGFSQPGKLIMPSPSIERIADKKLRKEIRKLYGEKMVFKYGTNPDHPTECWDWYVYRATLTGPDKRVYELPWAQVKGLCKDRDIKTVPELHPPIVYGSWACVSPYETWKYFGEKKTKEEHLLSLVETFLDQPEELDKSHIREGVCVRVETPDGRTSIFKDKGFVFKILEGVIKDQGVVDEEEAQDIEEEF